MSALSSVILAAAVMACGAGCAGEMYAGPTGVDGPPVVAGSGGNDGDLLYVQAAPAQDMGSYPSITYEGANVYYVGGLWYEHGPRGWAYFRHEPSELGRQREARFGRDHDPRWSDQRGAAARGQPGRGTPASQRQGVTEAQGRDHPSTEQHGAQAPAKAVPTAQARRKQATPTPATNPARGVKRAPVHTSTPPTEERR